MHHSGVGRDQRLALDIAGGELGARLVQAPTFAGERADQGIEPGGGLDRLDARRLQALHGAALFGLHTGELEGSSRTCLLRAAFGGHRLIGDGAGTALMGGQLEGPPRSPAPAHTCRGHDGAVGEDRAAVRRSQGAACCAEVGDQPRALQAMGERRGSAFLGAHTGQCGPCPGRCAVAWHRRIPGREHLLAR